MIHFDWLIDWHWYSYKEASMTNRADFRDAIASKNECNYWIIKWHYLGDPCVVQFMDTLPLVMVSWGPLDITVMYPIAAASSEQVWASESVEVLPQNVLWRYISSTLLGVITVRVYPRNVPGWWTMCHRPSPSTITGILWFTVFCNMRDILQKQHCNLDHKYICPLSSLLK